MNIEKRGDGAQEQPKSAPETTPPRSKKPVIIYIMILFIVAFLLMALSFVMHQRSNTEAMGQLQNSVNAMQAVQATQEKVISLQEELAQAGDYIDELNEDIEDLREEAAEAEQLLRAMTLLNELEQHNINRDYDACKAVISQLEETKLAELLPRESTQEGVQAPYQRFEQLKEAAMNH